MSKDTTRLAKEYERVLELNEPGNLLSVIEVDDHALEMYRVKYSCEGVVNIGVDGTPFRSCEHVLEVDLKHFPEREPQMKFLTPVWHPGVAWGEERYVDLGGAVASWAEVGSVAEALVYVGEMLQYKLYRNWLELPDSVKNFKAADWLIEYAQPHSIISPEKPFDARDLVKGASRPMRVSEAGGHLNTEALVVLCAAGPSGETLEATRPVEERAGIAEEAEAVPEKALMTNISSADSGKSDRAVAAGAGAPEVEICGVPVPATDIEQRVDSERGTLEAATAEGNGNANGNKSGKPKVIFGDLTQDEDSKPFPMVRLLHWKPTGKQPDVKEPPFSLVVTSEVLARANAHVSTDLMNELGGFLLGNRYVCPNAKVKYVQIDNYMPAKHASSGPISLEFMNETFQDFIDEKESKYRGKDALGWYHSHPDKGAFLSPMDDEVHRVRFPSQWTVALVIDPNKNEGGFFCWRDGELGLHAMMDFYELRGIKCPPTVTYMPWTNYKCFDSQTGEERAPQLAADAGSGGVPPDPGWHLKLHAWLKENRAFVGVAALLLAALVLGWRANLIGGRPDPVSVQGSKPRVVAASVTSGDAGQSNMPNSSRAASAGQSLGAPSSTYLFDCRRFKCKLAANFNERFEDLQAKVEGRPIKVTWNKNDEAIVDLSNTVAMSNIKRPDTPASTLIVYFSRANNIGVEVPIQLRREDALTPKGGSTGTGTRPTSSPAKQRGSPRRGQTLEEALRRRRRR